MWSAAVRQPSPVRGPARAPARRARGFTLVELLVAIVLIDAGLLAVVQTTAVVVRRRNEVRARAIAAYTAATRLEQLLASPCATTSGASAAAGLAETWSSQLTGRTRDVSDSVAFGVPASHVMILRTRVLC
jgi:prepilin-type N-terminal cleavage/methylation domain-containing protein